MSPLQTKIDLFSSLWGPFSFAKDKVPKDPLGFGLREDQKTKTEPELALSYRSVECSDTFFIEYSENVREGIVTPVSLRWCRIEGS